LNDTTAYNDITEDNFGGGIRYKGHSTTYTDDKSQFDIGIAGLATTTVVFIFPIPGIWARTIL
jgi:hypothetical protein